MQTETGKIYVSINDAARMTGLSRIFIRSGCREGKFPCLRVGEGSNATYMIHYERFLATLENAAGAGNTHE